MERVHGGWTMPDDAPHRSDDPPRPEQPFGERNAHKSRKTIVGLALMMLLSFLFYEFNGHTSHQTVNTSVSHDASSSH
jgi:hypothetical protein